MALGTGSRDFRNPTLYHFVKSIVRAILLTLLIATSGLQAQSLKDLRTTTPVPSGDTIVIGFLGGYERWDDPNRSVRKLIVRLGNSHIHAESFGNHHVSAAIQFVTKALDANGDGKVDAVEARQARIVIFGQSLGGNSAVRLARALERKKIPVLLTVQVDSVGLNDHVIPANVGSAVNLYQHELLTFWGERNIVAADPRKTAILANEQYHYPPFASGPKPESWPRRTLGGGHARMEADPKLWAQVESFIRQAVEKK